MPIRNPNRAREGIVIAKYIIKNKCTLKVANEQCYPNISAYAAQERLYLVSRVDKKLYDTAKEAQKIAVIAARSDKSKLKEKPCPEFKIELDEAVLKSKARIVWIKNNIKAGNIVDYRISYDNVVEIEVTRTFSNYFYGKIKGCLEECYYYQHVIKVVK
ncbi:hypothetical protein [Cellulosilyticum lentocellum]|uniref:Uncharacterized protein n=1 Tax=Cellulosilyticum lentocellum (strain ATCC 49066 / DSM 5427 / NCIMB 11756 / RHM5) TaxID=642492 RepID=F2JQT6_CELLD|nr:hypothetical protein [Cellulosilyticum lentocellum]ADZ82681.1 hypothetical protein Clole_0949 [Cellulosilyticum lentocellum DSM 5427]